MTAKVIVEPPRIYLDTSHLINVHKVRANKPLGSQEANRETYEALDDCIRNRHFGLIFNPAAPLEWIDGDATLKTAYEIAAVVDSAKLRYELSHDCFVWLQEVLAECRRLNPSIEVPDLPQLLLCEEGEGVERPMGKLLRLVPGYIEEKVLTEDSEIIAQGVKIPFGSAREHLDRCYILKRDRPEVYRERVDGYKDAFLQDVGELAPRGAKKITEADTRGWIRRYLKADLVLRTLNPGLDVDALLDHVEIERCPAVNLFLRAREIRLRDGLGGSQPKDNDVDDWMFLPVAPYADLLLTERNLRNYIHAAVPDLKDRVTSSPVEAVEILHKWMEDGR